MIVVLDNLRSALNVGSILRTCDAFGIKEVYFCGITPLIGNKKVLKTSLGAENNIKACEFNSTPEAIIKAKEKGYQVVGLELSEESINLKNYKKEKRVALVVGNEVSGLGPEVLNICDKLVKIPMIGTKESLNVSVAFGIAVYQISDRGCSHKPKE